MRNFKRISVVIVLAIMLILSFAACDEVSGLVFDNIDINAVDKVNVPVGTYTIEYNINDINKYAEQLGVVVAISVVDNDDNAVTLEGNSFTVEADKVYTVTITVTSSDGETKTKSFTITAVTSEEDAGVVLSVPANVAVNDGVVSFDAVGNATSYVVKIGDDEYPAITNSLDISTYIEAEGSYSISVKAVGDGELFLNSAYSEAITVNVEGSGTIIVKYPVTLDYEVDEMVISVNENTSLLRPSNTILPAREGYEFDDWYADAEYTVLFDFATLITQATTIYGKWNEVAVATYTVTFNGNGGTLVSGDEVQTVNQGEAAVAPVYTFGEYDFLGWDVNFSNVTSDLIVKALWDNQEPTKSLEDIWSTQKDLFFSVWGYHLEIDPTNIEVQVSDYGLNEVAIPNGYMFIDMILVVECLPQDLASVRDQLNDDFSDCFDYEYMIVEGTNLVALDYLHFPLFLLEEVVIVDYNFYSQDMATLIRYASDDSDVIIANSVVIIGDYAFSGNTSINTVVMGDSVEYIGEYSFANCLNLLSINISDSVTYIADDAFDACYDLTDINVSSGNSYYNSINGVLYNKDVTELYLYPYGKTDTEFIMPNTVEIIGYGAFETSKLESVTLSSSLQAIPENAFYYCFELTSIVIPDSVTYIADFAFSGCTKLESVTMSNSLTTMGGYAFIGCSSLLSIILPISLMEMGTSAFYGCDDLTVYCEAIYKPSDWSEWWNANDPEPIDVVWGYGLDEVEYSFETNGGTEIDPISIVVLTNIPETTNAPLYFGGWYDNEDCLGDKISLPYYSDEDITLYVKWLTEPLQDGTSTDTPYIAEIDVVYDVTITESGQMVYYSFTSSVDEKYIFKSYGSLDTHITIYNEGYSLYFNDDNVAEQDVNFMLICDLDAGETYSIVLQTMMYSIGEFTFDIKVYEEPAEPTELDLLWDEKSQLFFDIMAGYASDGSGLNFEDNIKLTSNGDYGIRQLVYEDGFTMLIAVECADSDDVISTLKDINREYGADAFQQVSDTNILASTSFFNIDFILSVPITEDNGVFYADLGLVEVLFRYNSTNSSFVIPDTVYAIFHDAFSNNEYITSVTGGNNLQLILDRAFLGCINLVSIDLPDSLTTIGVSAFEDCRSLESISIPIGVKAIPARAFYTCLSLESVTMTNSVESIGDEAFKFCAFTSITLSANLKDIGDIAFWGTGLTSIFIPESVDYIGYSAFNQCYDLTTVIVNINTPIVYTEQNMWLFGSLDDVLVGEELVPRELVIKVPSGTVDNYKDATGWSYYADRIEVIS